MSINNTKNQYRNKKIVSSMTSFTLDLNMIEKLISLIDLNYLLREIH